jgi:hypothetical protein
MSSLESLDPVLLTARAQAGERPCFRTSCARSPEATPSSVSRLEEGSLVDARLSVSEPVAEPVGLASQRGEREAAALPFGAAAAPNETRQRP